MRSQQQQAEEEDDAMDWTPTASPVRPSAGTGGQQVPPQQAQAQTNVAAAAADATTGLETLFERTNIDSSEPSAAFGSGAGRRRRRGGGGGGVGGVAAQARWSWGWVYALSLVPLIGVVYYQVLGVGFFALS